MCHLCAGDAVPLVCLVPRGVSLHGRFRTVENRASWAVAIAGSPWQPPAEALCFAVCAADHRHPLPTAALASSVQRLAIA
jgi:hypothetical protein